MPRAARTGVRSRRKINTKNNHKKKLAAPESDIESFSDKSDSEQEREPQSKEKSQSEDYFPERVVGHRFENGEKQYRVKWKGWASADNTWEPSNHLNKCSEMVARYEQSVQKKQEKEAKKAEKQSKKAKSPSIVPIGSGSSSISPKSRKKKKRISSLTPSEHEQPDEDDEYDNKSPQFITKRQKRKSLIQKNTSRFSDDNEDYKPSVSVDDDADDEDDEYDMDIDSKSVSNKNKALDIASEGEADSASDAESEQSEPTYTVEAIVKHRKSLKKKYAKKRADGERCMEYYVKWKDWDSTTNTWEHETELAKCGKLIDEYWEQKNREKEVKKNKKKKRKEKKVQKKKETAVENGKKEEKAIEIEQEKEEKQIVNKKKIKKKKYRARRTNIFSEEMQGNEDEGEHNDEDVKDNDVAIALEPDATERAEKRKPGKRKLCEVEEGDNEELTNEPPSKKRRIDSTKKVVMQYGGLNAFFHVLDDGDEADQEALITIVEKYDKRNFV